MAVLAERTDGFRLMVALRTSSEFRRNEGCAVVNPSSRPKQSYRIDYRRKRYRQGTVAQAIHVESSCEKASSQSLRGAGRSPSETELFYCEKGAFTGADSRVAGR